MLIFKMQETPDNLLNSLLMYAPFKSLAVSFEKHALNKSCMRSLFGRFPSHFGIINHLKPISIFKLSHIFTPFRNY